MSITEKEAGNPSEKKSRRRGKEKRSDRREEGQTKREIEKKKKEETMSNERVRVIRVSTTWIYIVFFR